ncbi:MAG TPA: pantoate--beta-alanine ligase [Oligoflexia bacterium]|nr:pantoate--beta-alanine ligase [Oligoflexia bacterium]
MVILQTPKQFQQYRRTIPHGQSVGFVPTMGALHAGHAELLKRSAAENQVTILSIFVNPKQFGPREDFQKYPRPFEADLDIAEACGVSAVFSPSVADFYPDSFSTYVEENALSKPLCGAFRPGHFRGVTTVVLKLFNVVRPNRAYFGLKDAQQFFVIKKMVEDLNLDLEIKGVPTVRENDGVALSSRNRYLSSEERERAPMIFKTLTRARDQILSGADPAKVCCEQIAVLEQNGFRVQYFEYWPQGRVLAAAAYLGITRLIDNVLIETTKQTRVSEASPESTI